MTAGSSGAELGSFVADACALAEGDVVIPHAARARMDPNSAEIRAPVALIG
jgi:hypothetical protein